MNKKVINFQKIIKKQYNYDFKLKIKTNYFPKGLNEKIIKLLSKKKLEPKFILNFRLKAYKYWKILKVPNWSNLKIKAIDFNNIKYFSSPKEQEFSYSSISSRLAQSFEKLGVSLVSKTIAVDTVFDSISIETTHQQRLAKNGIIFCSLAEGIRFFPNLIKKFLGSVVSSGDNFFAALNSTAFSDGSFCYIPQNIQCPLQLSTYFRINDKKSGQFERTLIIVEKNSSVNYIEGCTAIQYKKNQLHTAIVELIAFDNAKIKYSTIQNWYIGNKIGNGGIYNFVTKRGLAIGKTAHISWIQIEKGSSITWKYPSCILLGNNSLGEFYSITLTKNYQQVDTGTKMIHLGENTKSKIIVKGISDNFSKNSYRGLIKIMPNALYSRNFSQCDSFLIGVSSFACTYPYLELWNSCSIIEHEAKISKINEEQLFYLRQRGIPYQKAINLLILGFCKDIIVSFPLEFNAEIKNLLQF